MPLILRLSSYILAAFMAFMGVQKFIGDVPIFHLIETNLMNQWGLTLPWIDPGFRFLTGLLEIAAAAMLFVGLTFRGGLLSVAVIGGAIFTHLTVLGVNTPMSSAPDASHSPTLFFMAVVFFALACVITFFARKTP